MKYMKSILREAKDLSRAKPYTPLSQDIINRDELVYAWHGTLEYWALWFCVKGIDLSVEPPTKTLGRGNQNIGFSKIETKGLFVSADRASGFINYIKVEVKPSELGISLEMEQRGFTNVIDTLILGDCIIAESLPAKRIVEVRHNNKSYSRKDFINLYDDPIGFLEKNTRYMYSDTPLLKKFNKDLVYKEIKDEIAKRGLDSAIQAMETIIKYKDYQAWGTEEDALEILNWLKDKK